jgi:hypothetical protein
MSDRKVILTLEPGSLSDEVVEELSRLGLVVTLRLNLSAVLIGTVAEEQVAALAAHPSVRAVEDEREVSAPR